MTAKYFKIAIGILMAVQATPATAEWQVVNFDTAGVFGKTWAIDQSSIRRSGQFVTFAERLNYLRDGLEWPRGYQVFSRRRANCDTREVMTISREVRNRQNLVVEADSAESNYERTRAGSAGGDIVRIACRRNR